MAGNENDSKTNRSSFGLQDNQETSVRFRVKLATRNAAIDATKNGSIPQGNYVEDSLEFVSTSKPKLHNYQEAVESVANEFKISSEEVIENEICVEIEAGQNGDPSDCKECGGAGCEICDEYHTYHNTNGEIVLPGTAVGFETTQDGQTIFTLYEGFTYA